MFTQTNYFRLISVFFMSKLICGNFLSMVLLKKPVVVRPVKIFAVL
jgi:hypothetical protein